MVCKADLGAQALNITLAWFSGGYLSIRLFYDKSCCELLTWSNLVILSSVQYRISMLLLMTTW